MQYMYVHVPYNKIVALLTVNFFMFTLMKVQKSLKEKVFCDSHHSYVMGCRRSLLEMETNIE